MDTLYFFASDEDMYMIFHTIESKYAIKYCRLRTENKLESKPKLEFNTIKELDLKRGSYLIVKKTQVMETFYSGKYAYYENPYPDNKDAVLLHGRNRFHQNALNLGDYQLHIDLSFKSDYAQMLFEYIVRQVKRNCIKIKAKLHFYVGKELYKNKKDYIFFGQRDAFPVIITDGGTPKRWWHDEEVRFFMEKPLSSQLKFLTEVFSNNLITDYKEECKNHTVNWQIYQGVMCNLYSLKDYNELEMLLPFFNDSCISMSPIAGGRNVMEDLKEMVIYLAFIHKAEGITWLIRNLHLIPKTGYYCGSQAIVEALMKKKYMEILKQSLSDISYDEQENVKTILNNISNKRLLKSKDMMLQILNKPMVP